MKDLKGYYFITDSALSRKGNASDVASALEAGARAVQYRSKNASTREMCEEAALLRELCRGKALFLVNDRVDVALSCGADGVHLGQDDMPLAKARSILGKKSLIGLTVHSTDEAREAVSLRADYLGVSPIFYTRTKADAGEPGGLTLLREVRKLSSLPLVAIGGITLDNARSVIEAGADAVCAISAVVSSADPAQEIRKFQSLFCL